MSTGPDYCPDCGTPLETRRVEGRERAYCPACAEPVYRNPKPAAGVLVVDGDELLLVERANPPDVGAWSVPAGFLEVDEPPAVAASRELAEETGVTVDPAALELFDTKLVPHADGTQVLVIVYRAARADATGPVVAGTDAADAAFWRLDELRAAGEPIETGYEPLFRRAVAAD